MSKCSRSSLTAALALAVFGGIGVISAYVRLVRPWHLRWGATDAEFWQALLGDALTPNPKLQATHALTIHAPPEAIWPWLVQMGQGRGGFYSYEWIERLLGLHTRNANRIVPDLQELHAADEVPLASNGADASAGVRLPVDILVPNRALVMHADAPIQTTGAIAVMQPRYYRSVTWSFHLHPVDATNTRLIERWRADWKPMWTNMIVIRAILEPGAFLMQRKMLLGIKARAERVWNSRDLITVPG